MQYEFFIAGSLKDKDKILNICNLFDKYNIVYYCFLKKDNSYINSNNILKCYKEDLKGEKASKNLLLVLPGGKSAHIESGIAYGMGKKCYAIGEYDQSVTLYNIFKKIFVSEKELEQFLKEYNNNF